MVYGWVFLSQVFSKAFFLIWYGLLNRIGEKKVLCHRVMIKKEKGFENEPLRYADCRRARNQQNNRR